MKKYPETAMSIDVARYFRTKQAKPVSAKSYVDRVTDEPIDVDLPNTDDLTSVTQARTYKVNDTTAPGGKRDVEKDALERGYEYGSTIVPISQSDESITKLQTIKDFSIMGFVPNDVRTYNQRIFMYGLTSLVREISQHGGELHHYCSKDKREGKNGIIVSYPCSSRAGLVCCG